MALGLASVLEFGKTVKQSIDADNQFSGFLPSVDYVEPAHARHSLKASFRLCSRLPAAFSVSNEYIFLLTVYCLLLTGVGLSLTAYGLRVRFSLINNAIIDDLLCYLAYGLRLTAYSKRLSA